MYDTKEAYNFIQTLNVYTIVNNDDTHKRFLEYYQFIFNESVNCSACPNDIEQAIYKLNWIVKLHLKNNKPELMKADKVCKYTMKPKVRLYSTALGMMVTKYNCTDAVAEALIKENPVNKNLFILNETEATDIIAEVKKELVAVKPVKVETKPMEKTEVKKRGRKPVKSKK
jgi:hypothetical protein